MGLEALCRWTTFGIGFGREQAAVAKRQAATGCWSRDRSRDWYSRLLGFRVIEENREEAFDEWILLHPDNRMVLCLQQHTTNRGELFDPVRTGGDHLGLKVESREELDKWVAWFAENDVVHSPIADRPYGSVLCFKDPDDIQLEMFFRHDHP